MKKYLLLLVVILFAFIGCGEKKDNVIKFAGSGGYPPFNYISDNDEVIGFDVDVAKEIAKRLDMELKYMTTAWDGIIEGLRAGRYDGILGSMAITDERLKVVDFSDPYYYSGAQIITRKDSGIKGVEDLGEDNTVGLATGTTFEQDANKLGVQAKLYEDDNQTLMELINGRIDAVITDRVVGLNSIKKIKGGDELALVGSLLRKEECAIAFQKDDELKNKVNKVLQEMRADGTLKQISAKWFDGNDITVK